MQREAWLERLAYFDGESRWQLALHKCPQLGELFERSYHFQHVHKPEAHHSTHYTASHPPIRQQHGNYYIIFLVAISLLLLQVTTLLSVIVSQ